MIKNQWQEEGISITHPINENHIKGAIAYLLAEKEPVNLETIPAVLPHLLFHQGNEFYKHQWTPSVSAQVNKLHDDLFSIDAEAVKLRAHMHESLHIPKDYCVLAFLITMLTVLLSGNFFLLPPLLFVAWLIGFFLAKKDPYFLTRRLPRVLQNILPVALIALLVFSPGKAHAVLGVGDVVTDPGSYTYYVEQIKVATKELENLESQLKTAKSALDETKKMRSLLEGTYNHAKGTVNDLKDLQEELKTDRSKLLEYATKWLSEEVQSGEKWIDPEDIIGKIFVDPRKTKDQNERVKDLNNKYHARHKTLEQAIVRAEQTYQEMPERYKKIEQIAVKIDTTEGTKEALDLNNQLLAEILKAINDLVALTSYIGEAEVMALYEGADDETKKTEEVQRKETKAASEAYSPQRDYIESTGINLENSAQDEMKRILEMGGLK